MKNFKSPQSRTLSLLVGTALLLLLTSFLILQINQAYVLDGDLWINNQIKHGANKQLATLKTTDGEIVSGQVRRNLSGERALITVEIGELSAVSGDASYLIYFGRSNNPGDDLIIAQLGEPQQVNGQPKYILTGWGPKDWFDYDVVELRQAGSAKQKVVLSGTFMAER